MSRRRRGLLLRGEPRPGTVLQATVSGDANEVVGGGSDGVVSTTGTVIGFQSDRFAGFRFVLDLPPAAEILEAKIQFTSSVTTVTDGRAACIVTLWAEAADDAAAFSTGSHDITNRTKTDASVAWPLPFSDGADAWVIGAHGPNQKTPDLAAIVQEVVNRAGWVSGQHLVILVHQTDGGLGARQVAAIEHASLAEAVTHRPVPGMTCPWCGRPVPAKTRGHDRRFCSTAHRHLYQTAARKLGELALDRDLDFVHVFSGTRLDLARTLLPRPGLTQP